MVLQLGCAWNKNSFAILQRNQDKRPVPATPTQFHLSPKNKFKFILNLFKFQRNPDKRPVPATTTPISLSLRKLIEIYFKFI